MTTQKVDTFGTVVNCVDGRAQQPATDWIRLHSGVTYVDVITAPGADGILSKFSTDRARVIMQEVSLSVKRHQSAIVAVTGHYDCLANPCKFELRRKQIEAAAEKVLNWGFGVRVVGLYVNEWGSVDVICDTDADYAQVRNWL